MMSENLNPDQENTDHVPGCVKCGTPNFVEGHATKLCTDCRSALIKYPIPLWVKAFGAGIVLLMAVSWAFSPQNFKAAIALSRAERYESGKKYLSEQQELQKTLNIIPGSVEASAHLMIASFYNLDFATYYKELEKVKGKNLEDDGLLNNVNNLTVKAEGYFPSDSLTKLTERYQKAKQEIPDTTYEHYIHTQPGDVYVKIAYASVCDDKQLYNKSDSLLGRALDVDPANMTALLLRSIIKRELNQLDSSIYYCDKALNINKQLSMAISSKARTVLKKGDYKKGLELALECDELDKALLYNKATLAIAYHFNKKFKQRDKIVKEAKQDSAMANYMHYANNVISGKQQI